MSERSRTIKLFCPSLSKFVPFVASEEQKLDLGTISRTFGLNPATVKLNGHFISRGIDLIAFSVTWKSLLSFFSSKGLSTGTNDADALIVDGKLCKAGSKRAYHPSDGESVQHQMTENNGFGVNRKPQLEDVNSLKKKKTNESYAGQSPLVGENGYCQSINHDGLSIKRKPWLENVNPLKKKRMNEASSDLLGRQSNVSDRTSTSQSSCSYIIGNLKRPREEEMIMPAPCKRTR